MRENRIEEEMPDDEELSEEPRHPSFDAAKARKAAKDPHRPGEHCGAAGGIMNMGGNIGGFLAPIVTPYIAGRAGWSSSATAGPATSASN